MRVLFVQTGVTPQLRIPPNPFGICYRHNTVGLD